MTKKPLATTGFLSVLMLLSACAKHTSDIPPAQISSAQFNDHSCKQIFDKMNIAARQAYEVGSEQEATANIDAMQMGVSLVFWPSLLFLDGNTPNATEYSRLQGEFNALQKAGVEKNCNIRVVYPTPAPDTMHPSAPTVEKQTEYPENKPFPSIHQQP